MTALTDVTNHDRAAWADAALRRFREVTRSDQEDVLGDLLCDLMHWSLQNRFDFTAALDRARSHYDDELLEERLLAPECPPEIVRELTAALRQAVTALNTAPRFRVPSLDTDSYRVASICDRALAHAKEAGQ